LQATQQILEAFFQRKGLSAKIVSTSGTFPLQRYHIELGGKTEMAHISRLSRDIGLQVKALNEPIILPDYQKGTIRLEVMLGEHPIVHYEELFDKRYLDWCELPMLLGARDVSQPIVLDLQKMPHLLIGGTTGSGKSMMLHAAINTLMTFQAEKNIEFVLFDPKQVEFNVYSDHKAVTSISNSKQYIPTMQALIELMEERLQLLKKHKCRDIYELRKKKGSRKLAYVVVVIDELADLVQTCGKKFIDSLIQLAQKSRATGIHIIAATQHPSAKIVPGELKANFPYRIGCKVASMAHSRVLFDESGAERLVGKGDALIQGASMQMQRFRGALVDIDKVMIRQKKLNCSWLRRWLNF
jgi:S-DNA-T family DNA segregation ATPase FtsK/SpoIIIE